ncbi:MAG: hypothetical protein Q9227_002480 [Pyrenula ochraceoflavens]
MSANPKCPIKIGLNRNIRYTAHVKTLSTRSLPVNWQALQVSSASNPLIHRIIHQNRTPRWVTASRSFSCTAQALDALRLDIAEEWKGTQYENPRGSGLEALLAVSHGEASDHKHGGKANRLKASKKPQLQLPSDVGTVSEGVHANGLEALLSASTSKKKDTQGRKLHDHNGNSSAIHESDQSQTNLAPNTLYTVPDPSHRTKLPPVDTGYVNLPAEVNVESSKSQLFYNNQGKRSSSDRVAGMNLDIASAFHLIRQNVESAAIHGVLHDYRRDMLRTRHQIFHTITDIREVESNLQQIHRAEATSLAREKFKNHTVKHVITDHKLKQTDIERKEWIKLQLYHYRKMLKKIRDSIFWTTAEVRNLEAKVAGKSNDGFRPLWVFKSIRKHTSWEPERPVVPAKFDDQNVAKAEDQNAVEVDDQNTALYTAKIDVQNAAGVDAPNTVYPALVQDQGTSLAKTQNTAIVDDQGAAKVEDPVEPNPKSLYYTIGVRLDRPKSPTTTDRVKQSYKTFRLRVVNGRPLPPKIFNRTRKRRKRSDLLGQPQAEQKSYLPCLDHRLNLQQREEAAHSHREPEPDSMSVQQDIRSFRRSERLPTKAKVRDRPVIKRLPLVDVKRVVLAGVKRPKLARAGRRRLNMQPLLLRLKSLSKKNALKLAKQHEEFSEARSSPQGGLLPHSTLDTAEFRIRRHVSNGIYAGQFPRGMHRTFHHSTAAASLSYPSPDQENLIANVTKPGQEGYSETTARSTPSALEYTDRETSNFHPLPSSQLPPSPIYRYLASRDQPTKAVPNLESNRLSADPFAALLASPVRKCAATGYRLPLAFLTDFNIRLDPKSSNAAMVPTGLGPNARLTGENKFTRRPWLRGSWMKEENSNNGDDTDRDNKVELLAEGDRPNSIPKDKPPASSSTQSPDALSNTRSITLHPIRLTTYAPLIQHLTSCFNSKRGTNRDQAQPPNEKRRWTLSNLVLPLWNRNPIAHKELNKAPWKQDMVEVMERSMVQRVLEAFTWGLTPDVGGDSQSQKGTVTRLDGNALNSLENAIKSGTEKVLIDMRHPGVLVWVGKKTLESPRNLPKSVFREVSENDTVFKSQIAILNAAQLLNEEALDKLRSMLTKEGILSEPESESGDNNSYGWVAVDSRTVPGRAIIAELWKLKGFHGTNAEMDDVIAKERQKLVAGTWSVWYPPARR